MPEWQDVETRLQRVLKVAKLLDDKFVVPGTKIRFGLDPILGLLPGVGDLATAIAGIWLIGEAARMKAPRGMLIRMLLNWLVDSTLGSIPIAGDVFDVFWKSNRRNAELLRQHIERHKAQSQK